MVEESTDNRSIKVRFLFGAPIFSIRSGGGTVYTADSKSALLIEMWVRIPPRVNAGIVQWLVCVTSNHGIRVRIPLPAQVL